MRDGRPRREQTAARETHEFRRITSIGSSKRERRRQARGEQERGEPRAESTVESERVEGNVAASCWTVSSLSQRSGGEARAEVRSAGGRAGELVARKLCALLGLFPFTSVTSRTPLLRLLRSVAPCTQGSPFTLPHHRGHHGQRSRRLGRRLHQRLRAAPQALRLVFTAPARRAQTLAV